MFLQNSKLFRKFTFTNSHFWNCFDESGGLKWCHVVTVEVQAPRHWPVAIEKIGSRPGIGNDRTGAQLPPYDFQLPYLAAQQRRPAYTQTAIDICGAFLPC
jgi:hypothetical protein